MSDCCLCRLLSASGSRKGLFSQGQWRPNSHIHSWIHHCGEGDLRCGRNVLPVTSHPTPPAEQPCPPCSCSFPAGPELSLPESGLHSPSSLGTDMPGMASCSPLNTEGGHNSRWGHLEREWHQLTPPASTSTLRGPVRAEEARAGGRFHGGPITRTKLTVRQASWCRQRGRRNPAKPCC